MKKSIISIISIVSVLLSSFSVNAAEVPRESAPCNATNEGIIMVERFIGGILKEVENGLINDMPIDMIELDIKNIWEELGKINGTSYEEELLDEMFSRFCLGK